jgi:hypothetical protein
MIYEKTNESFSLKDGELSIEDKLNKVGFVVDCYGYPLRDPIVIKHGELSKVKKYFDEMKDKLMNSTTGDTKFSATLAESILFVDVSDWTAEEINQSLDTLHYVKNILIEKNIQIPGKNV